MRKQQRMRLGIEVGHPAIAGTIEAQAPYQQIDSETEDIVSRIVWVRQIRCQSIVTGIGFSDDKLVHLQANGSGLRLIRVVSLEDSVKILHACSRLEPLVRADIECDSNGWENWLELLKQELTHRI